MMFVSQSREIYLGLEFTPEQLSWNMFPPPMWHMSCQIPGNYVKRSTWSIVAFQGHCCGLIEQFSYVILMTWIVRHNARTSWIQYPVSWTLDPGSGYPRCPIVFPTCQILDAGEILALGASWILEPESRVQYSGSILHSGCRILTPLLLNTFVEDVCSGETNPLLLLLLLVLWTFLNSISSGVFAWLNQGPEFHFVQPQQQGGMQDSPLSPES